ncbi:ABC transporter permease [Paenibacillus hamazuiensis]|uniref:ABC transporter permease n=1 Tax=Paenibacillus hamazuiensis TaxID=2936508 RepID=UPI00200DA817|nr:ABC transporter permease [Paenibacillus hamazuiensis]
MNGILKAVRRFVGGLSVIIAASVLLFFAGESMGDPTYALLPMEANDQQREALRESLGLNGSAVSRLTAYLTLTLQGEFGRSYKLNEPVMTIIAPYFWGTMKLLGMALPIGVLGGIFLGFFGLFAGARADRWFYKVLLALHSLPGFVPAILAIELFAVQLKWVPPSGSQGWSSLVLPVALLAGAEAIKIGSLLRSKFAEILEEKFVLTAKVKGVGRFRFYVHYVLRPALSLIFSFVSIQVGVLLSSAVVVESVFAYPGIGSLAVQALSNRDLPLLQACLVITTLFFLCSRFLLDLIHPWLDPRVKQTAVWERSLW